MTLKADFQCEIFLNKRRRKPASYIEGTASNSAAYSDIELDISVLGEAKACLF